MSDPRAEMADLGFETLALHAGQEADASTGAVVPPIHQVSTYKQDGVGGLRGGYEYSRSANPTRTALEECLAALDGGAKGMAFASGLAAEDTLLRTVCAPGDHVVIPGDAYGGTYRLFSQVLARWGLEHTPAGDDIDSLAAAVQPGRTKVVWVETPTNPLLSIVDIAAAAQVAHDAGALLVVDSTFASPYLQQPIALGADVVGGALVAATNELGERLQYHQNAMGAVAGPFDSWLVLRGIKTLALRMERHSDNAERVVDLLVGHPAVDQVLYPGLPTHPRHVVAAKQMRRFGGMVSFRVTGGVEHALQVVERTRLFTLAESLGGVESLIEHPARMTHQSAAGSPLEVPDDLVRVSVGVETVEDLLADLSQALS
jgi:cystathionine gamma-synthase